MIRHKWALIGFLCVWFACFQSALVHADNPAPKTVEQVYPGLAVGMLKKAQLVPLKKGTLLVTRGLQIKASQLNAKVEAADPSIRAELRRNLFFLLEQEAVQAMLVQEARSSKSVEKDLSDTEAIRAYLDQKFQGVEVSEAEAKAFYEANKAMVQGMPFEQVKETIQQVLVQQKRQDAFASYLQDLGEDRAIQVNAEWVGDRYALAMDNPVDRARRSGKPTMVEFGATGCVPCDMMQPILEKLRKKFPDALNVVFVHVGENRLLGARFGIRSIPVQVFYDKTGQEVFRHVGFFAEEKILKQLTALGVT
jgi:thiol-disulfide isomerase/thioredoxin